MVIAGTAQAKLWVRATSRSKRCRASPLSMAAAAQRTLRPAWGKARDIDGRAGIEQHNVPGRTRLAIQHALDQGQVGPPAP